LQVRRSVGLVDLYA